MAEHILNAWQVATLQAIAEQKQALIDELKPLLEAEQQNERMYADAAGLPKGKVHLEPRDGGKVALVVDGVPPGVVAAETEAEDVQPSGTAL